MSKTRMPVLTSLDSLQRKRKREKQLGRTKMKRDLIMQNLSKQNIDVDEIHRLQKLLKDVNKRISTMQGAAVSRTSVVQIIICMIFCFRFTQMHFALTYLLTTLHPLANS